MSVRILLRTAATSALHRSPGHQLLRRFSVFQDFSRKLKGELDRNPELNKSLKDFQDTAKTLQEKAGSLRTRTKKTAEDLYKQVYAARDSAVGGNEGGAAANQGATGGTEEGTGATGGAEKGAGATGGTEGRAEKGAAEEQTNENNASKASAETGNSGEKAGGQRKEPSTFRARVAAVAREGYNLLADELTSTNRLKPKPFIPRSSASDMVPVAEKKSEWRKRLDGLKDKVTEHPLFRSFKTVKEHPVVQKSHEIAEEMRERWETSDSPVIHKIQDINDSIFGETANAMAMKEIRSRDPSFSFPDFVAEVQEDVRPILTAYLKGDFEALRKKCCKEVVERCRAEHRAFRSQGMFVDNKILYISDVELKDTKMLGSDPIIIVSFQTQQSYCVRDEHGNIKEGSKDDIRTIYYAWAMQQVPYEELNPEDPRWRLREMQQLGVRAII